MSDRSSDPLDPHGAGSVAPDPDNAGEPDSDEEPVFGRVDPPKPTQYQEADTGRYRFQSRNAFEGEEQLGARWPGQRTVHPDSDESFAWVNADGDLVDRYENKVDTTAAQRQNRAAGSAAEGRHIVAMSGTGMLHVADEKQGFHAQAMKLAIANAGGPATWRTLDTMTQFTFLLPALQQLRFHHSSLVRGKAVAAAGEIAVDKGEIQTVSDKSGHYKPDFAMTAQMHDQLSRDLKKVPATQASDGGTTRADTVTWELGNYEGDRHKSDTRLSGTEMAGYLDDVPMETLMAEAARSAAQRALDASDGKTPESTWERAYDAELKKLSALSERERYARVRELIETRHQGQRTVLADIPRVWLRDPLGGGKRQRERIEGMWTPWVRDYPEKGKESEKGKEIDDGEEDKKIKEVKDEHFHRIRHQHDGWKHDLIDEKRWRYWRDGAWTERVHANPSHSPSTAHPEYADADGQRVLNEVLGNHRLDSPGRED